MRIALAQFTASTDLADNLQVVLGQLAHAADAGARLVVFPEAMICSFARPRVEAAEPLNGPWATAVRQAASACGVTVVVGMFTPGTGGKVRNTLLVTGPGVEDHYDKLHLFDAYGFRESEQMEPGHELVVVDIEGIRFGLATCYDIRFPELFTSLGNAGAEVILVPSSWAPGERKVEQWRSLAIARALDSTCFVVAVDQAEPPPDPAGEGQVRQPTGVGHSIVAGPLGEVLLELGAEPQLALVDLDPAAVAAARETLPVLANSRFTSTIAQPSGAS